MGCTRNTIIGLIINFFLQMALNIHMRLMSDSYCLDFSTMASLRCHGNFKQWKCSNLLHLSCTEQNVTYHVLDFKLCVQSKNKPNICLWQQIKEKQSSIIVFQSQLTPRKTKTYHFNQHCFCKVFACFYIAFELYNQAQPSSFLNVILNVLLSLIT